jgi:transposase
MSLAADRDGMNRADAARISGMDRYTLRDWVHASHEKGHECLRAVHAGGVQARLSAAKELNLLRSLRRALTGRRMASFAGGGSIFNLSSRSDLALTIVSDT